MTYVVETASDTEAKITITITPDEIRKGVQDELRKLSHEVKIPGFRPGKVPQKILLKKYGESVSAEVHHKLIEKDYQAAVEEHELRPVAQPNLDKDAMAPREDGSLQVEFELEMAPNFQLGDYKALRIDVATPELQEGDVEREVETLRHQGSHADLVDGAAADGDWIVADLLYQFLDGTSLPPVEGKLIDTGNGTLDGMKADIVMGRFVGSNPGDEVKLNWELPAEFPEEESRGKTAVVTCTVKEVRRMVAPDLDDAAFLETLGVESKDQLEERVRENLQHQMENRQRRLEEDMCMDQLVDQHPFQLPQGLFQRTLEQELDRFRKQLDERKTPVEEIEKTMLEVDGRARQQVERKLRETFLLDRIAEEEGVKVEQEDLEQHFQMMAMTMQMPPQQIFDHFVESGNMPGVLEGLRRDKTRSFLRGCARNDDQQDQPSTTTESEPDNDSQNSEEA